MKGYEWGDLWNAMDACPKEWQPTTEAMYNEMLGVLFPQAMEGSAFLVGEPNHHNKEGLPVYACFRVNAGHYEAKYLTEEGFKHRNIPVLKVVCCECKKVMKEGPNDNVSHGQCRPCQDKFLWRAGLSQKELTEFINERNQREIAVEN